MLSLNTSLLSGVRRQLCLRTRTLMSTWLFPHGGTLVLHVSVATTGFGSCVPRYSSVTTSYRRTIKQERMMVENPGSNHSAVKAVAKQATLALRIVPVHEHGIHYS